MNRTRHRFATISLLFCCLIMILLGIISLVVLLIPENYPTIYYAVINDTEAIVPNFEAQMASASGDEELLKMTLFVTLIVMNILYIVLAIPGIVVAVLCLKDGLADVEVFQKRKGLHIFQIVSIGLALLANSVSVNEYTVSSSMYMLRLPILALLIIALGNTIRELVINSRVFNKPNNPSQEQIRQENDYNFEDRFEKPRESEEYRDYPDIKEEKVDDEKVKQRQEQLEKAYELLAKLEKSYKNGEISKDDYDRMKKTILDDFMNN